MARQVKSELQKAADRVRVMQVAVQNTEKNLEICAAEWSKYDLLKAEAGRNLEDTRSLLNAQRDKLEREVQSVRNIVGEIPF